MLDNVDGQLSDADVHDITDTRKDVRDRHAVQCMDGVSGEPLGAEFVTAARREEI